MDNYIIHQTLCLTQSDEWDYKIYILANQADKSRIDSLFFLQVIHYCQCFKIINEIYFWHVRTFVFNVEKLSYLVYKFILSQLNG